jgi:hypothetical protein
MAGRKERLKHILGEIPLTAEIFWLMRQSDHPTPSNFSLRNIKAILPDAIQAAEKARTYAKPGKKVFLFASTHYWLEHEVMLGLALTGLGHQVTLAFYPYAGWNIQSNQFDIRRQSVYANSILKSVTSLMKVVNLYRNNSSFVQLTPAMHDCVEHVSDYDFMYAYQTEEVDREDPFYQFRFERNLKAAKALYSYLRVNKPDVAIIPNGTILELGVAYKVCRSLKIPTSTYEFNDQRGSMWLAQNDEIMQQNTDYLWAQHLKEELKESELNQLESLMSSRKNASLYGSYMRKWQKVPSQGESVVREKMGLDKRPVILLATNVMGDSLTLGRNIFTKSMTEWIIRTVQYFIEKPEVQLVIRIHPGEALVKHGSIHDMIKQTLPELPDHIHLIDPLAEVNTYDLMDVADLGMVFTTTVGLEMAMRGIPVIVAGKTHYRKRGFTFDPDSWVEYFKTLNRILEDVQGARLSQEMVDLAWKYTYLFFFKYPHPFPWHMAFRRKDFKEVLMPSVLSKEGLKKYQNTFDLLVFNKQLE